IFLDRSGVAGVEDESALVVMIPVVVDVDGHGRPAQGVPIGDDLVTLSDIQNVTVEDEPDRSGNALVEEVPRKVRKFLACHARRAAVGTFKDLVKLPVNASPNGAD